MNVPRDETLTENSKRLKSRNINLNVINKSMNTSNLVRINNMYSIFIADYYWQNELTIIY